MTESSILKFDCRLLSPYHTTQHTHRSLLRCDPHILGSSLRGVILSYLIQTKCSESYLAELVSRKSPTEIQKFHRSCPEECLIKEMAGEADWLPVFSFGEFKTDFARGLQHRVAIDRERRTVAVGKIVSIEVIPEGTEFQFSVALPGSALYGKAQLEQAVRDTGKWFGVGHHKSIGFGRFEVTRASESSLLSEITRASAEASKLPSTLRLMLLSSMVLQTASNRFPLETGPLGEALGGALFERTAEVSKRFDLPIPLAPNPILPGQCRFSFRPDYIHRDSFEEGTRKNALVALPESWFDVSFTELTEPLCQQLAVAQVLGVGSWADVGFGRLRTEALGGEYGQPL
jgi:hypothetical protein